MGPKGGAAKDQGYLQMGPGGQGGGYLEMGPSGDQSSYLQMGPSGGQGGGYLEMGPSGGQGGGYLEMGPAGGRRMDDSYLAVQPDMIFQDDAELSGYLQVGRARAVPSPLQPPPSPPSRLLILSIILLLLHPEFLFLLFCKPMRVSVGSERGDTRSRAVGVASPVGTNSMPTLLQLTRARDDLGHIHSQMSASADDGGYLAVDQDWLSEQWDLMAEQVRTSRRCCCAMRCAVDARVYCATCSLLHHNFCFVRVSCLAHALLPLFFVHRTQQRIITTLNKTLFVHPRVVAQPWFRGDMKREAAKKELEKKPVGAFVVRVSQSEPGHFALSVVQEGGKLDHMLVLPSFAGKHSNAPGKTQCVIPPPPPHSVCVGWLS
jgi:hypothetical protein